MLKRFVPHQVSFDQVEKLNKWNNYILIASTLIVIVTTVFDSTVKDSETLNDGLNGLNSLLIFSYIFIDIINSYLLQRAEAKRRLDFIDNSFDTNLSGLKSENYFTNSQLAPGLHKMAVNCFENSLFSHNISKRMLPTLVIKNFIIISIFILAAALGEKQIVVILFQLSLPVFLFQQMVRLFLYVNNTETVLGNFQVLFNDLKDINHQRKTPEILRNIIHYESNISWGSIMLFSRLFNKLNPTLSVDWETLKKEYRIMDKSQ